MGGIIRNNMRRMGEELRRIGGRMGGQIKKNRRKNERKT